MAGEDREVPEGPGVREAAETGEGGELPPGGGTGRVSQPLRTPLFLAQHSERYARQTLIRQYEDSVGVNLIVVIDQIFPDNLTYLEELLFDLDAGKPLHLLLASPGGDGETAIRMVRTMQSRCSELTVLVPDMAKSAATLLCLGAHKIVMGPAGDLGPVDPQLQIPGGRSLASAKEIVAAIDEAEDRVRNNPDSFPLFASLLSDLNMLMVEQARSSLGRTEALVREALEACPGRTEGDVDNLAAALKAPLIDDPKSHSAVISCDAARRFGLPAEPAELSSIAWTLIWQLWTRYFVLKCFPAGTTAVYEGRRASAIVD
jgi:Serine dehydrogenase proteinase